MEDSDKALKSNQPSSHGEDIFHGGKASRKSGGGGALYVQGTTVPLTAVEEYVNALTSSRESRAVAWSKRKEENHSFGDSENEMVRYSKVSLFAPSAPKISLLWDIPLAGSSVIPMDPFSFTWCNNLNVYIQPLVATCRCMEIHQFTWKRRVVAGQKMSWHEVPNPVGNWTVHLGYFCLLFWLSNMKHCLVTFWHCLVCFGVKFRCMWHSMDPRTECNTSRRYLPFW